MVFVVGAVGDDVVLTKCGKSECAIVGAADGASKCGNVVGRLVGRHVRRTMEGTATGVVDVLPTECVGEAVVDDDDRAMEGAADGGQTNKRGNAVGRLVGFLDGCTITVGAAIGVVDASPTV